jgi:homotetrameric cytidine deaminase
MMTHLSEDERTLLDAARDARTRAYTPYSGFPVGAAVEVDDGRLYSGANIENAAYPQTVCAERVAIFKAVSEGARRLRRVAVVSESGASPCGGCRSVMAEFGDPDTEVLISDLDGHTRRTTLGVLLPDAFEMAARGPTLSSE